MRIYCGLIFGKDFKLSSVTNLTMLPVSALENIAL